MKQTTFRNTLMIFTVLTLFLAACSPADVSPTPTQISVEAITTNVAATIFAGQTQTELAKPSSTPTATSTLTPTATPTSTATLVTPTKVVYVAPVQPIIIPAITTTGTPGTLVPSLTPTLGGVGCNNSSFVQNVTIPDNTNLSPGESFTKTWRIKNTGTCAWSNTYKFTFVGGDLFGSDTTKIRRNVGPGTTFDFSLAMVAPNNPGTYTSSWRMADDAGKLFGAEFSFTIRVPGATSAPTETPVPPTPYP